MPPKLLQNRAALLAILSTIAWTTCPAAASTSVDLTITGADAYAIYLATQPTNTPEFFDYVGDHTATSLPDLLTAKTYNTLLPPDNGYIFIVAWGGPIASPGLLVDASFSTGQTYLSGDSHWEVSTPVLDPGDPDLISYGDPAPDGREVGAWADLVFAFSSWSGPTNSSLTNAQGGIAGTVPGIAANSRWMWSTQMANPILFRLAVPASAPTTNIYFSPQQFNPTNWDTATNWLPAVVPSSTTDVTFANTGDTNTITLTTPASTKNFNVHLQQVTVDLNGTTLSIGGDLAIVSSHPLNPFFHDGLTLLGPGTASVAGNLTNSGVLQITNTTLTVNGNATNHGYMLHHNANFNVVGTLYQFGVMASDPSTIDLGNLILESGGSITGSPGDLYIIHGDLTDLSLPGDFNTPDVNLRFFGSGPHTLSTDNDLAFHDLTLDSDGLLILTGTGSLSLHELLLPDTNPADLASELQSTLDITYDPNDPANSYLLGNSYSLIGGGSLSPQAVPEPASLAIAALGVPVLLRRRRR